MRHFTRRQPLFTQKPPGFSSLPRLNAMKPRRLHLFRKPCLLSRSLRTLVKFAPSASGDGLKFSGGIFDAHGCPGCGKTCGKNFLTIDFFFYRVILPENRKDPL